MLTVMEEEEDEDEEEDERIQVRPIGRAIWVVISRVVRQCYWTT